MCFCLFVCICFVCLFFGSHNPLSNKYEKKNFSKQKQKLDFDNSNRQSFDQDSSDFFFRRVFF